MFEARYRALVTDALARDRRLAVVGLRPGWEAHYAGRPPVYAVAGAGEIAAWERLGSGRYHILVRGRWRVRIERELPADTLYRLALAEPLADRPAAADPAPALARIRATCRRLLQALGRPPDLLDEVLAADQAPGVVADRVASAVLPDAALRQELLETLEVERRLERVAGALEALADQLAGGRE